MDHLFYSLESVVPLFVLILIGYLLRRRHIINDSFIQVGTTLGFKLALPVLLFQQISNADFTQAFNPKLILFSLSATLTSILLLCLLIPRFIKENARRGAMIQGIYRGNFAILGVPLAINMFGETGAAPTSLLLPFTIPLYNALAVIILTVFSPDRDATHKISLKALIKDIVANPLIIGIALGLPFSIFTITLHLNFCNNLINLIPKHLLARHYFFNFRIQLHNINFLSGILSLNICRHR